MQDRDSVFSQIIVEPEAGPLDEELSELPEFPPPQEVEEPVVYTTADLVAIYSLLKAGYTAEDFS